MDPISELYYYQSMSQGVMTVLLIVFYGKLFEDLSYHYDIDTSEISMRFNPGGFYEDVVKTAIFFSRGAGDVSYDAVVYDPRSGVLSVDGLKVNGPFVSGQVGRIRLSSTADDGSEIDLRLEAGGVEIDLAALEMPSPARQAARDLGIDTLRMNASVEIAYDFAPSDAIVEFTLDIDRIGRVSGYAKLTDLHIDQTTRRPFPAGKLQTLVLSAENDGLLDVFLDKSGLGQGGEEGARLLAAEVSQQIIAWFAGADVDPSANTSFAQPVVADFAASVEQSIATLLIEREGASIVIEPQPPLDLALLRELPETLAAPSLRPQLITALQPKLSTRPKREIAVIGSVSKEFILSRDAEAAAPLLDALITGVGAPRDLSLAIEILEERGRTPAERLTLAKAYLSRGDDGDKAAAYEEALIAAAAEIDGAAALVTKLATELPAADILAAEAAAQSIPTAEERALIAAAERGDGIAMRRLAGRYEEGRGAPRSLAKAYRWAVLGAAAGDAPAARMRDRLAARFAYGSEEDQASWNAALAAEEAEATRLWNAGIGAAVVEALEDR